MQTIDSEILELMKKNAESLEQIATAVIVLVVFFGLFLFFKKR